MKTFEFRTGEMTESTYEGDKFIPSEHLPVQTIQAESFFQVADTLSFYRKGDDGFDKFFAQFAVRGFWYCKELEAVDYPEEHEVFE